MSYTLREIQEIIQAKPLQLKAPEAAIQHLALDSRHLLFPRQSLFFAIVGERHDGHDFVEKAYAAGVRSFVISQEIKLTRLPEANILQVKQTTQALQQLAGYHRHQFTLPVIAITGSNGKTIVKEWLASCLEPDQRVVRSPRSFNSQVGVPLSLWQIEARHQIGIFEAGISEQGEMALLAPIIDGEIGLFTNIGQAHAAGFESLEQKIQEKLHLFEQSRLLIYCKDHLAIHQAVRQRFPFKKTFTWAQKREADLRIDTLEFFPTHTFITATYKKEKYQVQIPFTDAASIENALHCWAAMLVLQYPMPLIQHRLRTLSPIAMRLELKAGINDCTLINDAYSADLTSLSIALQFLAQQEPEKPRTLILTDLLQSGLPPKELYQNVAALLQVHKVQRLIGIGTEIPLIQEFLPENFRVAFFSNTLNLLENWAEMPFEREVILLKGARTFELEKVAGRLSQKEHATVLEIDLNALRHNLQVYTQPLGPGTQMLVMVKAEAYGSGAFEVARLLEYHQVDYLGVAYSDEGVVLRKAGIKLPILVLNPSAESFESMLHYQLEPEIYSLRQLQQWIRFLPNDAPPVPIHLKLETGMHRLGFEQSDLPELISFLQKNKKNIHVSSIFSHLAASEDKGEDLFSHQQAKTFLQGYEQISKGLGYSPIRHLLNSSGILRFPEYHFEMVRLGIGVYGFDASGLVDHQLRQVLSFKAGISQIRTLQPGDTVGYGRRGVAKAPMRIATISAGYADGLLRLAGNGRFQVKIRGKLAPTIGNICMDMSMIDITSIPEAQVGDPVLIFGAEHPVKLLAEALQTIPYEVFTNISTRVKRVYVQE